MTDQVTKLIKQLGMDSFTYSVSNVESHGLVNGIILTYLVHHYNTAEQLLQLDEEQWVKGEYAYIEAETGIVFNDIWDAIVYLENNQLVVTAQYNKVGSFLFKPVRWEGGKNV